MKKVFITGVAGSGKSTVSRELAVMGYPAHDIEDSDYDLFVMVRKDTGEIFKDYDNSDLEKVNAADWICDPAKLKTLLDKQTEEVAFYCGIAKNNADLAPLFDTCIILHASDTSIDQRLTTREGTSYFANTKEGRERVISYKDDYTKKMEGLGMIRVDANGTPREVAEKILEVTRKQ